MFRWFKITSPVVLVAGVVLLNTDGNEWWKMLPGVLMVAWGLAFIQARD